MNPYPKNYKRTSIYKTFKKCSDEEIIKFKKQSVEDCRNEETKEDKYFHRKEIYVFNCIMDERGI